MADRVGPIAPQTPWPGVLATALLAALGIGSLGAVLVWAGGLSDVSSRDMAAIRFTLLQALLSSALSCLLAIPLARALARRAFPGRAVFLTLFGAPFILPVIVAVMGLLVIFGRAGLINWLGAFVSAPTLEIYGLAGVVLAHVFFNLPLVTRMVLHGWLAIPAEQFRLADTLAFNPFDRFRWLEVPMLRQIIPGAFALVFLICSTSFAVALIIGGGPRATTIELAIYQAFRFEFDLAHAATLAIVQVALGCGSALLAFWLRASNHVTHGLGRAGLLQPPQGTTVRLLDGLIITTGGLFIAAPMVAIVANGLGGLFDLGPSIWLAITRSLLVATFATALAICAALAMSATIHARPRFGVLIEAVVFMMLAVSPLVIGVGLFLILFRITDPVSVALPITGLINAAVALPFAVQIILPAYRESETRYGRLSDHLALTQWARMRWVTLPRLRRPLGFAAGLTGALSIGDLGVVALFADPARPTLPLYTYQLMGAYRSDAAAGSALVLLVLTLGVFWMFDRGGRPDAKA